MGRGGKPDPTEKFGGINKQKDVNKGGGLLH